MEQLYFTLQRAYGNVWVNLLLGGRVLLKKTPASWPCLWWMHLISLLSLSWLTHKKCLTLNAQQSKTIKHI